ncbi:MAG: radical SAM protein, partial [Methanocorpusculum sp.]|nr:radical SAM protein [Methanocorpusculum sp.]
MYKKHEPADARAALHRQGYNFFSDASTAAVKPCMWCKRSLRGGESCYKHQFYGIESSKCVQMTPTLRCNQRCLFCWRSMEHEIDGGADISVDEIIAGIPRLQRKGLSGDKPFCGEARWEDATMHPTQFAISLSGEPTLYPHLPELVARLRSAGGSVFVVSNGTNPRMIEKIAPTQLYLSLDAVAEGQYEKICRPMGDPAQMWANIHESLSLLRKKEAEGVRTAVRITLVAGYNDMSAEGFANIILASQPIYVEIKG